MTSLASKVFPHMPLLAQHKGIHTSKEWGLDQTRLVWVGGECALIPFIYNSFHVIASKSHIHHNILILNWMNELESNDIVFQIDQTFGTCAWSNTWPCASWSWTSFVFSTELNKVCGRSKPILFQSALLNNPNSIYALQAPQSLPHIKRYHPYR